MIKVSLSLFCVRRSDTFQLLQRNPTNKKLSPQTETFRLGWIYLDRKINEVLDLPEDNRDMNGENSNSESGFN